MNPDISLATKSGHFYLLTTLLCEIAINRLAGKLINGTARKSGDSSQLCGLFGGELNIHGLSLRIRVADVKHRRYMRRPTISLLPPRAAWRSR